MNQLASAEIAVDIDICGNGLQATPDLIRDRSPNGEDFDLCNLVDQKRCRTSRILIVVLHGANVLVQHCSSTTEGKRRISGSKGWLRSRGCLGRTERIPEQ